MMGRGLSLVAVLVISALLAAIVLPQISLAQDVYDTRWLANKQLVTNWHGEPASDFFPDSQFALGPAAWQVVGKISDGFYYNEGWQTAANNSTLTIGSDGCRIWDCANTSVSISNGQGRDWLESIIAAPRYGALGPQGQYTFSLEATNAVALPSGEKNPSFGSEVATNGRGTTLNSGITDSCTKTQNITNCNLVTGEYSASRWIAWSTSEHGGYTTQVTAIPLSWQITGKICNEAASCGY